MGKKYYISDISKELKIGKSVLCEYLKTVGVSINIGTNSYISQKQYERLIDAYRKNRIRKTVDNKTNYFSNEIFNLDKQRNIRAGIFGKTYRKNVNNTFDDFKSEEISLFIAANNNVKEFQLFIYDEHYDNSEEYDDYVLIETNNTVFIEDVIKIKNIPINSRYTSEYSRYKGYELFYEDLGNDAEKLSLLKNGRSIVLSSLDWFIIWKFIFLKRKREIETRIKNELVPIPQKLNKIKGKIFKMNIDSIIDTFTFWRIRKKYGSRKPGEGYDYWTDEFYSIKSDLMYEVDGYFWDIIHMRNPQYNELVSEILDKYEKPEPKNKLAEFKYIYPKKAELEVKKAFKENYSTIEHIEYLLAEYYKHQEYLNSKLNKCKSTFETHRSKMFNYLIKIKRNSLKSYGLKSIHNTDNANENIKNSLINNVISLNAILMFNQMLTLLSRRIFFNKL